LGLAALITVLELPSARIAHYANLVNPQHLVESFGTFAAQVGDSMTHKYSRDDAGLILFFGLLATLVVKFVQLLGPFGLLLLDRASWRSLPGALRSFSLA